MIEITSGSKYIDIDGYASCIAYAELLKSKGEDAKAITTTKEYSNSITKTLLSFKYKMEYKENIKDKVIILDICNPKMISNNVLKSKVIEVIDHHPYKESIDYWKERNVSLHLEEIGSICTIIYEKIKAENKENILTKELCKLLIAGILDNSLNLKAKITKQRDINAFNDLMKIGSISPSFPLEYFKECQEAIESNLLENIENDLKIDIYYSNIPRAFGQILIVDIDSIMKRKKEILEYMNEKYPEWCINIICLKDGKSYILTSSSKIAENMNKILKGNIKDKNLLELEHYLLRKEILMFAQS